MPAKRKTNAPPSPKIHICYICGREIYGEEVVNKTKRNSTLRIHNKCYRAEVERNRQDWQNMREGRDNNGNKNMDTGNRK